MDTCPVYSVTVHGGGSVEYRGVKAVALRGRHTMTLPHEKVVAILEAVDHAKFFGFLSSLAWAFCVKLTVATRPTVERCGGVRARTLR
jgi:hypothetical protein